MATLSAYLQIWRLKLGHIETLTTAFHLNRWEAKRELKVYNNNRLLPFSPTPSYLGEKLDRSHTFHHHLVALRKTIFERHTAEASCRLRIECWCQNTAHSCPISGLLNSWVLHTSLVSQRSHTPHIQCLEWRLAHSHWMPASQSNGPLSTNTFRDPTSWASPTGSNTLLGLPWISGSWSCTDDTDYKI